MIHIRMKRIPAALLAVFLLLSLWTGPTYAVRETEAVLTETEEAADTEGNTEEAEDAEEDTEEEGARGGGIAFVTPLDDLAEVIRECERDADMLVLLEQDLTFSHTVTVTEGQNITLDLDGHTLTYIPEPSAERQAGLLVEDGTFTLKSGKEGGTLVSQADHAVLLAPHGGETTVEQVTLKAVGTDSVCIAAKGAEDAWSHMLSLIGSTLEGGTCALEAKDYTVNISEGSVLRTSGGENSVVIRAEDTDLYLRDSKVTGSSDADITGIEAVNESASSYSGVMLYNDTQLEVSGAAAVGVSLKRAYCSLLREEENAPSPTVTVRSDGTAVGINAVGGSVGLGGTVRVTGARATGVFCESADSTEEGNSTTVSASDASLTVTGTEEATGLRAIGPLVWLAGRTELTATAPSAIGIQANGGSVISQNENTLITADASGAEGDAALDAGAAALAVYAQEKVNPEKTLPLYWMKGSAKAVSVRPDSAYALIVDYREGITADGKAQVSIQPGAGTFEGKLWVMRNGEQVKNSGLVEILGGTYTVEPDAGDIAGGYTAKQEGASWRVVPAQEAAIINIAGEQATPCASFAEAWNTVENGGAIRLYKDVTLEETLAVPAGKAVVLELNGASISPAEGRELTLFRVEGTLSIQANSTASELVPGDSLIYGGKLTGGKNPASAGAVLVTGESAVFVMEGGEITGNSGKVGGIEAEDGALVTLMGTAVTENTGSVAGGILAGGKTGIHLKEDCYVTDNTGTGPGAAGGILTRDGDLSLRGARLRRNRGCETGGLAAFGGVVNLTNSTVSENNGGRTGGVLLEGTAAVFTGTAEGFFDRTMISDNYGGLAGGVEVASNSGSLSLIGDVEIKSNAGNCPLNTRTLEADTEDNVSMNLVLRYDGEDGARPFNVKDPCDGNGEALMIVSVDAIRVVHPGETPPDKGFRLFTLPDSAGESGEVYAVAASVTGPDTPENPEDGWPFLNADHTFGHDDYTLIRDESGAYVLKFTSGDDEPDTTDTAKSGCYVATAVYGSYDCPQVWTLRRFRDETLGETWYGRLFIRAYYAASPIAVELFGDSTWFQNFFRGRLDRMVSGLQARGVEATPYEDRNW